eukprot:4841724-Amphidinium_carterae.1
MRYPLLVIFVHDQHPRCRLADYFQSLNCRVRTRARKVKIIPRDRWSSIHGGGGGNLLRRCLVQYVIETLMCQPEWVWLWGHTQLGKYAILKPKQ